MKYVGKNIPRNDGFDKATGLGQFTMDVSLPRICRQSSAQSLCAHREFSEDWTPLPLKLCQA